MAIDPHDVQINEPLEQQEATPAQPKPAETTPGLTNITSESDRALANARRSRELNDVTFEERPVEQENFFALKVKGQIKTPPTSSRQLLEAQLLQLPEDERQSAAIVAVDASGQELLLG